MKLLKTEEFVKCVLQGRDSMSAYFKENEIPWVLEDRLSLYKTLEMYEVHDQEIVGYAALREKDGAIYLADIQIFEKFQNKGYGTEVLKWANTLARDRGFSAIYLKVFKTSPAVNLYYRNGYTLHTEEQYVYVLSART
jgi:GNAT superfamily N-acetyltransferase